jgi:hypothetical protein
MNAVIEKKKYITHKRCNFFRGDDRKDKILPNEEGFFIARDKEDQKLFDHWAKIGLLEEVK